MKKGNMKKKAATMIGACSLGIGALGIIASVATTNKVTIAAAESPTHRHQEAVYARTLGVDDSDAASWELSATTDIIIEDEPVPLSDMSDKE